MKEILEKKVEVLWWLGHVSRMDRAMIVKRTELKYRGQSPWDDHKQDGLIGC
jgi:hypothetical protein